VKKIITFFNFESIFGEIAWILNSTFPEQTKNRKPEPAVKIIRTIF